MKLADVKFLAKEIRDDVYCLNMRLPSHMRFANDFTLANGCGVASFTLCKTLLYLGETNVKLALGEFGKDQCAHAWAEWNEYIIDITADQFDTELTEYPDVFVVPINDHRYHCQWRDRNALRQMGSWDYSAPQSHEKGIRAIARSYTQQRLNLLKGLNTHEERV